jgi:CheY-like chemotaxis protein
VVTAPVAIGLLGALTFIAIAVACVATLRARAARAALRASDAKPREGVERDEKMDARRPLAGEAAHDLNDLLTTITGHTELLIASLDPTGTSIQAALEIRRAAWSAARLTSPLRTLSGGHPTLTNVVTGGAVEPAAGPDPAVAETRFSGTMLVVEDEPHVRELIRLVLVQAGHKVLAVAGPHAALAALNSQPSISLILVDVVMPEMDGYDLVVEARKISPAIRVVLMSGFAYDTTRHRSGDGFLAKPFTVESLSAIVEAALAVREPLPLQTSQPTPSR